MLTLPVPDAWGAALDRWELFLRSGGRSVRTIETRVRHVRQVARGLGIESPRDVSSDALMEYLGAQVWAAETRHGYYESLRLFFRWLMPTSSPAEWLPVVPRHGGAPRPVPLDVLHDAMGAADARTRLILCLGACAGLRASEISAVHGRDVVEDACGVSLTVAGKGGRVRLVPLASWLARSVVSACTAGGGWCFPSKYGGHISGAHISKLAAEVLRDGWTLHTLRHRFATAAYSAERDLLAVQRLLGHASVATTQRYAAPPDEALRRAIDAADFTREA